MKKIVVYTGTKNVYKAIYISLKSLLFHNKTIDEVYLLIQDDDFPYRLPPHSKIINVSNQKFFPKGSINFNNRWTYMTLMRAVLPKIFPNEDIILSLDVDTIIQDNIEDIWNFSLDNFYMAAALQPSCSRGGKYEKMDKYFNFGVVLYNLKKLRDDNKVDEIINILNIKRYNFLEQDAMNELCANAILQIPSDYNVSEWTKISNNPKIIHYAGIPIQKWINNSLAKKYQGINLYE